MSAKTYSERLNDTRYKNVSGIYKLIINNKIYVGSAVNLSKRLRCHLNSLLAKKHHNIKLQRAFNKYQAIDFEVIENTEAVLLIEREQYYIDTLCPYYNISPKAGSQLGFKHSEKTKAIISKMSKEKIITESARRNISLSKKGIPLSDIHKKNISFSKMGDKNPFYKAGKNHPQYGTHKSEATKIKLSGDNNPSSKTGVIYDVETGANYIFRSLKSMCKRLGITYNSIKYPARNNTFYKGRFFVSYVPVPKGCETTQCKPIFECQ